MRNFQRFSYLHRRDFLAGSAAATAALAFNSAAAAQEEWRSAHGLSIFGDLAEKPDFKAFGYVRTDAPKGGAIVRDAEGSFNSLNAYILEGDFVTGMWLTFDSLMSGSLDEHDAMYGLVAQSVDISPDKNALRFHLRKEARFHDGSPLRARDVAFSLNLLKEKAHPVIKLALRGLESAEAQGEDIVLVKLAPGHIRDLPLIVARQPIFSADYYGKHSFTERTLNPPLGSSAYKVGRFEVGRYIQFDRVPDYWAKDLPVNVGQNNFDVIRYDYYLDRPTAFEAFKTGSVTAHEEATALVWATGYDFPAVKEKRVLRTQIPDFNITGVQGWIFNSRRPKFQDARVRQAIACAFDFKWTNTNLMASAYKRSYSFFQNSDLMAQGVPQGRELEILEAYRGKLPEAVFGEAYMPPESDGSGQDKKLLRQAMQLFNAAGYKLDGTALKGPDGQQLQFEFLYPSKLFERHTLGFAKNLELLGVKASIRSVDPSQYIERTKNFDFDIVVETMRMQYSPGEELRTYFGSEAAKINGSRNLYGVSDPVVDDLIAKASSVEHREELVYLCRALDRILRANAIWIPQWYKDEYWIAHWDVFGRPEKTPRYDPGVNTVWWWDADRAKAIDYVRR